jgi:hypothetical protein
VGEPRRPVDGIVEEFRNAKTSTIFKMLAGAVERF